ATLVDLKALADAASEERRSVLNGTAGLIGELIVADESQDEDAGDEERDQRRVPTLTVLLESRGQHTWPEAHAELRSADVPYSVVDPLPDGTGVETLWLPGMRIPMRRTVARRRGGALMPLLTWREHVLFVEAAAAGASYAELADGYLSA